MEDKMRLTKTNQQFIRSLSNKKDRDELGFFVAEGIKVVQDLIESGLTPYLVCNLQNSSQNNSVNIEQNSFEVSESEMAKISNLKTPPEILAVFKQKRPLLNDFFQLGFPPILFLDELQDPGNMGTLIRTADWFGIKHIVCTKNSVDCFNPKVIQATMGSIARVNIVYLDMEDFFKHLNSTYEIVGTFMEGNSIYEFTFKNPSVIVIGNEGKGISKETQQYISKRISIPKQNSKFGNNNAESLNASVVASIVCYEFAKQYKF